MNRRDHATLTLLSILAILTAANLTIGITQGDWWTITITAATMAIATIPATYLARKHRKEHQ